MGEAPAKNGMSGDDRISKPCSYLPGAGLTAPARDSTSIRMPAHIFIPKVAPTNQQEVLILAPRGHSEVDGMCR